MKKRLNSLQVNNKQINPMPTQNTRSLYCSILPASFWIIMYRVSWAMQEQAFLFLQTWGEAPSRGIKNLNILSGNLVKKSVLPLWPLDSAKGNVVVLCNIVCQLCDSLLDAFRVLVGSWWNASGRTTSLSWVKSTRLSASLLVLLPLRSVTRYLVFHLPAAHVIVAMWKVGVSVCLYVICVCADVSVCLYVMCLCWC